MCIKGMWYVWYVNRLAAASWFSALCASQTHSTSYRCSFLHQRYVAEKLTTGIVDKILAAFNVSGLVAKQHMVNCNTSSCVDS